MTEKSASLMGIFISAAASEPVHAPVPGSGMATKMSRPNVLYFSICANLLHALASMRSTSSKRVLRIQSKILLIKSRMNGVGKWCR